MTFMSIMNSFPLYILVIAGLSFVFALCLVTLKQARQRALELGLSKEEIMGVIKSSALFSIVPSLSVVVGLFSLQLFWACRGPVPSVGNWIGEL